MTLWANDIYLLENNPLRALFKLISRDRDAALVVGTLGTRLQLCIETFIGVERPGRTCVFVTLHY